MAIRSSLSLYLLVGASVVAGCASQGVHLARALSAGDEYVALGSSFAAGAAIGPLQPGSPERCGRTVNNYASLLAARLDLSLDDQSCGGATTAHVVSPWNELPAQIDAVRASTRLVTVTIGGNDVNYVGNLLMASCTPGEIVAAGDYEIACVAPSPPSDEDYLKLERGLREIVREVKSRAPNARLVLVQYVSLVPDAPCDAARLAGPNAEMVRSIGFRLADITARVARSTDSLLLEADKHSRDHNPCAAEPWSNGMTKEIDFSQGPPWHPNERGHQIIAEELVKLLNT